MNAVVADHEENQAMNAKVGTCPDCEGLLRPIRLVDATSSTVGGFGEAHVDLAYTSTDAKPSFFFGTFPCHGIVRGKICSKCGRILLFGEPVEA